MYRLHFGEPLSPQNHKFTGPVCPADTLAVFDWPNPSGRLYSAQGHPGAYRKRLSGLAPKALNCRNICLSMLFRLLEAAREAD